MSKEKIIQISNICLILFFVILISGPLIFINKDPNKISSIENKKLAKFPDTYKNGSNFNTSFNSEFEEYINDNIGFKEEAVILDIVSKYKFFNKFSVQNYIMGKDKNLFYNSNGKGIETFQGKNLYMKNTLDDLCNGFINMKNCMENAGANYYITTIPDKESVYPELYTEGIRRFSDKTRVEVLTEYIRNNSNLNILNLKQALINNKGNEMLYYKNYDSTHWNMNGAFIGYTEIMKILKKDFPELNILSKYDFNIIVEKSEGSLAHLSEIDIINKTLSFDDDIFLYNLKDGYSAELSKVLPEGIKIDRNDKFYHYRNVKSENNIKILIIGDSYIYSYLLPIMAESFNELYFINFTSAEQIMYLQSSINADIVLYEFVERAFDENKVIEFKDYNSEYVDFYQLPTIESKAVLNVDSPKADYGTIKIDNEEEYTEFNGWGIDAAMQKPAKDIYLKVGDKYFLPKYVQRKDLTTMKDEYIMSGFKFRIPTEMLNQYKLIEFIIISNDGTYQYRPVSYTIK